MCLVLGMAVSNASTHVDFGNVVQDKARYWQSLGRADKATEAWGKILLSMPENQEAILWLGINNAYAGNSKVAKRYLEQLEKSGAKSTSITILKRAIKMGVPEASYLKKARALAKDKKAKEAIAQYQLAFHNIKPTGHLAAEYYQTAASLPNGWEEASKGLKTLAEVFPKQDEYQYIYARHLSYKESTRRTAIDRLSQLAAVESSVSERATQDWYQALVWLQFKKGDQRYFDRYLKRFPDNKVIKSKRKSLKRLVNGPSERDSRLEQAYAMMKENELDHADAQFDYLIQQDSRDAEALAGRAILNLKRERFEAAVQGLERAIQLEPEFRSEWQPPLTEARFWVLMKQSEALRNQSDLEQAEKILRDANKLLPGNIYGRMALADVLVDKGELKQARQIYTDVVKDYPSNIDVKVGLAHVLAALDERKLTVSILDEIEAIEPKKILEIAQLRTQFLAKDALTADDERQRKKALEALELQLVKTPNNPWVRLDLARVYHAQGALEKSNSLLDGLLVTHSDMPAVLYARALLFEQEGKNIEGMLLLEKISVEQRSGDMRQLQHRLWVKSQTERARTLADYGQIELAHEVLNKVASVVEREHELIGLLASAWSDLGDTDRALQLLRKGKSDDLDLQLNYASVLLYSGQDAEGELVVKQLLAQKLSQAQKAQLADLVIGHSIRRANEAREQGNFALAYDYLAPVMFQYGDDDRIVLSMASLFASANENDRALTLYRQVLAHETGNMDALQGAVGVAIKGRQYDVAEEMLAFGMAQNPDDARLYTLRGQLAKAQGNDNEALSHFQYALELERANPSLSSGGTLNADLPLQLIDYQKSGSGGNYQYSNPFRSSLKNQAPLHPQFANRATFKPITLSKTADMNASYFIKVGSTPTSAGKAAPSSFSQVQWQRPMSGQELAITKEIQGIESKYSTHGGVGLALRNRSGDSGLDQLVDFELPMSITFSPGYYGLLQFKAVPVLLDAGNLKLSDLVQLDQFGSYAVNQPVAQAGTISQDDTGVALGLSYRTRQWSFNLGSTPLGFTNETAVGALSWTPVFGLLNIETGLFRQSVTDSLLSYAGAKDQATGTTWGGVTENGFRFSANYNLKPFGVYGGLKLASVTGENIASNNKFELNAGFYTALIESKSHEVSVGVNFSGLGFSDNLSKFTYGHGGYFSPRNYLAINVPVNWYGKNGAMSYQLGGSIGIQSFREDDTDYYPNDLAMQQQLEQLAVTDPSRSTFYEGQSVTGVNFSLQAGTEYALTSALSVGAKVTFANAKDYDEFTGIVYLRAWAEPQSQQGLKFSQPIKPFYEGGL